MTWWAAGMTDRGGVMTWWPAGMTDRGGVMTWWIAGMTDRGGWVMTWWPAGMTDRGWGDDVVACGNDERQIYGLRATCRDRGDGTDQTPAVPSETRGVLSARRGFVVDLRVAQGLLGNGPAIRLHCRMGPSI